MSDQETRYAEGSVVATPEGAGVVAAVLTSDFEFPQGEGDLADVSASTDRPAYVVGLESGGSTVFRAAALRATSFGEEHPDVDGEALTDTVDEEVNALDSLPEGWDRESVLEYWSSIGGTWDACVDEMREEFEKERAKEHCSAMKDEVLRTERWRNRF